MLDRLYVRDVSALGHGGHAHSRLSGSVQLEMIGLDRILVDCQSHVCWRVELDFWIKEKAQEVEDLGWKGYGRDFVGEEL